MNKPLNAFFFRDFKNSYMADILEEIYLKKVYEPFLIGKKELIIADIGANQGYTSYYFKDYAKQVYAIEPAKEHQEVITEMIKFNKLNNITLCPYAISNTDTTTKFYHNDNVTMYALSDLVNKKDDFEEVEVIGFDTFMERNKLDHIDLLKLDPEGEESKILTSEGFAKYSSKVKVIVGEWHQWTNMEKNQFANVLTDLGYQFNWLPNMKASVYTAIRL